MVFCNCTVICTSYGSWRNEKHARKSWKDIQRSQSGVNQTHAKAQAMHELTNLTCESHLLASDDLTLWTEAPQTCEFLGDICGKKLRDVVAPECVQIFDTLLAPLINGSSTSRILMTPPITLRSDSHSVRAIIMVVDAGELHQVGEFSWRYLIGLKDLQYVSTQGSSLEVAAKARECSSRFAPLREDERDINTTDTQTETGTTLTSRLFANLRHSMRTEQEGTTSKGTWQALVDLGRREHWLIPADDIADDPSVGLLGTGGFGSVRAGFLLGSPMALKTPHVADSPRISAVTTALANELRIMRHLRHPYLVMWYGACVDPYQTKLSMV